MKFLPHVPSFHHEAPGGVTATAIESTFGLVLNYRQCTVESVG